MAWFNFGKKKEEKKVCCCACAAEEKITDTQLLAVSIVGMEPFSLSYLTGWVDMCFSSYFTAVERPVRSLLTSFFGTLVFPIATLFILTPIWQLNGVWLSAVVSCTASAVLTLILATFKHA